MSDVKDIQAQARTYILNNKLNLTKNMLPLYIEHRIPNIISKKIVMKHMLCIPLLHISNKYFMTTLQELVALQQKRTQKIIRFIQEHKVTLVAELE